MSQQTHPPRGFERLLRALVRGDRLEHAVLGDMAEEWAERAARDGERVADRWYRREALHTTPHLLRQWLPDQASVATATHRAARVGLSWVDLKLGIRMLVKYPGLTLVGGLAIALAVAIGGAWFEFSHDYFHPTLPLPEGDRIVGIQNWNVSTNARDPRALHDFVQWRRELHTIHELGAYRPLDRNLITADGHAEPVGGVAVSASMFQLVRVRPLLGRPLAERDEAPGATPVAVIGYGLWQSRFGGDSRIVGRTIRFGAELVTVVGVMPEGFAFPYNQSLWVPLDVRASDYTRGRSPPIGVFGRLAPGATIEMARAELATVGRRMAAEFPATNGHLRPRVLPFVESTMGPTPWQVELINLFFILILLIACTNVATLVFARTATREREIAVRRALGASRGRIIAQLFAEALVLASAAAAVGILVVWWGQGWGMNIFWGVQGGPGVRPFWWNSSLSLETVLYAGGLTVLGAAVVGVLPALKATRGGVQPRLQQLGANGRGAGSGRFGVFWTGVIVVQVALAVIVLPGAAAVGRQALRNNAASLGFTADEYLSVRLEQDRVSLVADSAATTAFIVGFQNTRRALEDRLREMPEVLGVTAATKLPGTDQDARPAIEVEGVSPSSQTPVDVNASSVDIDFFDTFGAAIDLGRGFNSTDVIDERKVVIVNQSFVREILRGANPIGRRLRIVDRRSHRPGPWQEIVGVAPDLGMNAFEPDKAAGIYQPLSARMYPIQLAVHLRGDAGAFAPRLREIAAAVDPRLRLYQPRTLAESAHALALGNSFGAAVMGAVAAVALLLSGAGIYALMSFTVARRTREIGIRVALGASARGIVTAALGRALTQVGTGAAVGTLVAALSGDAAKDGPALIGGVAAFMLVVGLLACLGPIRRALRIQPTEALRTGD